MGGMTASMNCLVCGHKLAIFRKLSLGDFPVVQRTGADIAGVRGAACEGGRAGRVLVDKVRALKSLCCSDEIRLSVTAASNA